MAENTACYGKKRHETYKDAEMERRKDRSLNIYKCPYCQYFHVGHKPAKERARKPKQNTKWSWRDEIENLPEAMI